MTRKTDYGYLAHLIKPLLIFLLSVIVVFSVYGVTKPMPDGTNYMSEMYFVDEDDISFLSDITYVDSEENRISEQEIFDAVFEMIQDARNIVLIDMFLFNDYQGKVKEDHRALSSELTAALVTKKKDFPDIDIILITDPINNVYGGDLSEQLKTLSEAGITVVETNLEQLRDSNVLYSGMYSALFQWLGIGEGGFLPHPFKEDGSIGVRAYLKMLNFKANHRKVVLTDDDEGNFYSLITSANPHDGSSAHTNVAIKVKNSIFKDVFLTESAVTSFSGVVLEPLTVFQHEESESDSIGVQLLTEKRIKEVLMREIEFARNGDSIDIMMFYLSDRDVVKKLLRAADRGVTVRLLLDPNKDAFGREKNGIPNRQVANELMEKGNGNIVVKWYDTHGEQNHAKMVMIHKKDGSVLILGSANLTRRNIDNFNLETNVFIQAPGDSELITDTKRFFERAYSNNDGNHYSVEFSEYQEDSSFKFFIYFIMETFGLSTF